MSLPGYSVLAEMPAMLEALLRDVDDEDAEWIPAPGRWSIQLVLGHLAHVEEHGFRARLVAMVNEDNPPMSSYDPDAYAAEGLYATAGFRQLLADFAAQREQSLRVLEGLDAGCLSRTGTHSALGMVTVGNMMNEWALHDLGHLRQVAELLRARKYYPHMGPWQKVYTMNP